MTVIIDWHSAVHSHWQLIRLLRLLPALPEAGSIRAVLHAHLTPANLQAETAYFAEPGRESFERPYGWAGVHSNTAFGLAFALDYADAVGDQPLRALRGDFFSPVLIEADLMRRVLPAHEFTPRRVPQAVRRA